MAPSRIENPALIERFVKLIPFPYPLAALVWSVILPTGPGFLVIQYLAIGTLPFPIVNFLTTLLNFLLPLYLFLMVRYIRLRVVASETAIAPRLSGGEQEYQRVFGRMTQTAPVIILAAILGTVLLSLYASLGVLSAIPSVIAINIIIVNLNVLAFSTYLWEFLTASWGLHRVGGSFLRLGSFLDDRMMGSKPMGNLALSLTAAYFGGLLLTDLLLSTFLPSSILGTALFLAFLFLGIALFFLPLNSIHARMQAEKHRLMQEVVARYPRLNPDPSEPKGTATMDDVHTRLIRLTDLQEVEMLDRKIASLPTWPFDIQVVSRFITIVLSVTAVLLSRLITNFLHI
ncbi:MAG TPA: hypothetical protein VNA15_00815 [Candidatus Angelobacter sp.]|nr:hypothetical protein [Candidatus Angelobacter sp.]